MRTLILFAALAMLPAMAAAQQVTPEALPSVELPAELDRVLRDYERAWQAGDVVALAALFAEDGFVPSRHGWRRGSAAIREQYASAGGALQLRAHEYAMAGSVGYIIGAYGYGDGPGGGKFILALRRNDQGRWLITADLDNANRPE